MAATRTLPLDYELVLYSGTTFRREFRWLSDGTNPIDLTGWSASMNIGQLNSRAVMVLTDTNGGITLSAIGQIIVTLSPAQTDSLAPGVLNYNLDLQQPNGDVRRFLRGRISVIQDVKDPLP
jgi:hypothetical protein